MRPGIIVQCGALVWLTASAGCIPFVPCYYVCPSVSCVPGVEVDAPADEVHVFRVDVADDDSCVEFMRPSRYRLTPMRVWPGGRTCPQVQAALDRGWVWNCLALSYGQRWDHTVRVRLYRRGYELLELCSWEWPRDIDWKRADYPASAELAIDSLLAPSGQQLQPINSGAGHWLSVRGCEEPREFWHLKPSGLASQHRQSLEFAIAEYDHLATACQTTDQTVAQRCAQKAERLRVLLQKD